MIRVIYEPEKRAVFIEGHAGYDEKGKDIVCAGVSVLVFTLANACNGYKKREGGIFISCPQREKYAVYDAVISGLKMIEKDYPENLLLTRGRIPLKYRQSDTQERLQKGNKNELYQI